MSLREISALCALRFAFNIDGVPVRCKNVLGFPVELEKMRFERSSALAFFSSALRLCSSRSVMPGRMAKRQSTGLRLTRPRQLRPIEQSTAVRAATVWPTRYYGIGNLTIANAQERSMPIHFWLSAFTAPGQSKGGIYYSIVLPDGAVVDPKNL